MSSRATAQLRNSKITGGAKDPFTGVGCAERQRELFDGRELVILPDNGHWPFKDAPQRSNARCSRSCARSWLAPRLMREGGGLIAC